MSDQNQKICTDCAHHSHRQTEGGWDVVCRRFPAVIDPTDGSNVASSVPVRRERKPQSKVDRWFKWERCGPDAVFFLQRKRSQPPSVIRSSAIPPAKND